MLNQLDSEGQVAGSYLAQDLVALSTFITGVDSHRHYQSACSLLHSNMQNCIFRVQVELIVYMHKEL